MKLSLELNLPSLVQRGTSVPPDPPTGLALGGAHSVAEDEELGFVVGALTGTDPEGGSLTWSVVSDPSGLFDVSAANLIVAGVLDFETDASHPITLRATSSESGLSADLMVTIAVTDVSETPPEEELPEGEDEPDDPGNFDLPPYTVVANGTVKLAGKKKANGSTAKFIHNVIDDIPLDANTIFTMKYDPDFTLMSADGVLAMVGFMFKAGNDFYLVGLRGDGSAGIHAYEVQGDNLWNQISGFTVSDGGVAENGTQAGPNWIQLQTSADGTTISFRTSGDDGDTWDDEWTDVDFAPFGNVSEVTAWGPGAFFHGDDDGPYSISVDVWVSESAALPLDGLSGLTGAWSMSRQLRSAYVGAFYAATTNIDTLNDQSGNSRNLAGEGSVTKPALSTAGPLSVVSALSTTTQRFQSAATVGDFFNAGEGYMIVSCLFNDLTAVPGAIAQPWNDNGVCCGGTAELMGINNNNGPRLSFWNWDGSIDQNIHVPVPVKVPVVLEWWHEGGNLMSRINGGTTATVASGDITALTDVMFLMTNGDEDTFTPMHLFEAAFFDDSQDGTIRDALCADFKAHVGAGSASVGCGFSTSANDTTDTTTYSFASQNIGQPETGRHVIAAVSTGHNTNPVQVNSVTIGGVAATQVADGSTAVAHASLWIAAVPSGTTATIAVVTSATATGLGVGVFPCYPASATPVDTDASTASPGVCTLDCPDGGFIVACISTNSGTNRTHTWTNLLERYDDNTQTTHHTKSGASTVNGKYFSVQTALVITCTHSGAPTASSMVAASFL